MYAPTDVRGMGVGSKCGVVDSAQVSEALGRWFPAVIRAGGLRCQQG